MGILGTFKRLKSGLSKTSENIASVLKQAIGLDGDRLSADTLDELETALIRADVGINASENLLNQLQKKRFPPETTDEDVKIELQSIIAEQLTPLESKASLLTHKKPHVILMVGVNGSGKTTTTAKLAEYFQAEGKTVQLAAADTFRAGAVEQLRIWAERTKTPLTLPENGKTDAAAVAYKATEEALLNNIDTLIIDTAGRLQNRADLMEELAKIRRTITKHIPEENISTLLVLDGTVGQNALSQLKAFSVATALSGLIITKLDSSAKGGIVLALTEENAPPIHFITTGETVQDMHPFNAQEYAKALLN